MPFCPKCGYEYNPGISKCPDCDEYLVDFPPDRSRSTSPDAIRQSHDWIKLARLPSRIHAEMLVEGLKAKDIPAMVYSKTGHHNFLGDASLLMPSPSADGYYIMVREKDVVEADHEAALMLGEIWEKSKLYDIEE